MRDCTLPDCETECFLGSPKGAVTTSVHQCINQDCSQACGFGVDWSCVGQFAWGTSKVAIAKVELRVTDIVSGDVLPNMTVKACSALDDACGTPLGSTTTDTMGRGTLHIPLNQLGAGFFGYLTIIQPDDPTAAHPTFIFFGKPILHDEAFNFLVATQGDVNAILAQFKAQLNPNEGMLFASAADCRGVAAPNVFFEVSPTALSTDTASIYFNGLAANPANLTTKVGTAAFLNVKPVNLSVIEHLGDPNGQRVGTALGFVQAGAISEMVIYPSTTPL